MSRYTQHTIDSAPDGSRPALESITRAAGFIPNLVATMAESPEAVNGYMALEAVLAGGTFTAVERQLLHVAISSANGCDYCIAAHSAVAASLRTAPAEIAAARGDAELADPRLGALTSFARAVVRERGHVGSQALDAFLAAGFTRAQALEVATHAGLKTISNYIVGFAHVPLDGMFAEHRREPNAVAAAT